VTVSNEVGDMTRTRSVIVMALLIVALAAAAEAQTPTPPPATPPAITRQIDRSDLRRQIYVMEGALVRAVASGVLVLNKELRSVAPEMMTLSGQAQARGVYLDGYGVYFDVGVPVLHQSIVWSVQTLIRQNDKGVAQALNELKTKAKEARTAADRAAMENAIAQLEVYIGPTTGQNMPELSFPPGRQGDLSATVSSGDAPSPSPPAPGVPRPPAQQIDRKKYLDTNAVNDAYTKSVQEALIDAMLDYSVGPLRSLRPDEYLTVGARDNMQRDSLAPPDPFEEIVTILLRIKGSDLAAYHTGQIERDEARKRVQVRQF
jgi:hypothetical protein